MTKERFKELLEELDGESLNTLTVKNARYSSENDALHNFKVGAAISGMTPAQTAWGYMTKHLTALRDMIQRDNFANKEDLLEKIQDSINYLRFSKAIIITVAMIMAMPISPNRLNSFPKKVHPKKAAEIGSIDDKIDPGTAPIRLTPSK